MVGLYVSVNRYLIIEVLSESQFGLLSLMHKVLLATTEPEIAEKT